MSTPVVPAKSPGALSPQDEAERRNRKAVTLYGSLAAAIVPALVLVLIFFGVLRGEQAAAMSEFETYRLVVPILGATAVLFVFGLLTLLLRAKWAVTGCAVASLLVMISYLVPAMRQGRSPVEFTSLFFVLIPLVFVAGLPWVNRAVRALPAVDLLEQSKIHKVGTLTYTKMGLVMIFFWLLWGDLVWTLMETVFESSLPLQLDRIDFPQEWIGYLTLVVAAIINLSLVPVISFRSDRTRTRWGRRIPYIVVTMPFLCFFLVLVGMTDTLGPWIKNSNLGASLGLSPVAAVVLVIGSLVVLFDISNVFVNSVFWYLFRDVVPAEFMGRFMGAFRMVGALAHIIWAGFVYGHVETHTSYIYIAAAATYFFGFGLMCLMIKEGEYPAPKDVDMRDPWLTRVWRDIKTYFRECFTHTHPLFIAYYISQGMFAIAAACGMYKTFFYLRHLGFTTDAMGKVGAIMGIVTFWAPIPFGWLADKIHPMRGYLIAATCVIPMHFAGAFIGEYTVGGFVLHAFTMYVVLAVLTSPFTQLGGASEVPLMMRIFPQKQFGQFSSANAMLRHFSRILGGLAGATFMGVMHRKYGYAGNGYAFIWHGTFQVVAVICLWIVFWYWRRSGAEKFNYDAEAGVVRLKDERPIVVKAEVPPPGGAGAEGQKK